MKDKVSARRWIEQQTPNDDRITWMKPVQEETELSDWTVWWDTSRRYRVVLSVSKYGLDTCFYASRRKVVKLYGSGQKHAFMRNCGKLETYRHIESALEACEAAHCKRFKKEVVDSNREEVIIQAAKLRLDRVTVVGREGVNPGKPRSSYHGEDGKKATGLRISFLGHPVTGAIRWMGVDGFTFAEARKVCDAFGIEVADNTIRCQLAAGKKGERGPAAELSQDQIDKVYAAMEE